MTTIVEWRPGLWLTEVATDEVDVRGAVIAGERAVLVWDTLTHPRDMRPVLPLVGGREPIVAYSHADWDHVWGTAGLAGVEMILGHDACRRRFADPGDVEALLAQFRSRQSGQWEEVRLIPPTVTFTGTLTVDLGGVVVELHPLPGHTADCLVAFVPAWGILLAGDTVETPYPIVNDGRALPGWIALLKRWAADPCLQTVIPCHGEIGDRSLIEQNIAYLESLTEEGVLSAFPGVMHRQNVEAALAARRPGWTLRPLAASDRDWVRDFLIEQWGSVEQVLRGQVYHADRMPGFAAERAGKPVGLVTYELRGETGEIMTLNSLEGGRGIGRALVEAVAETARAAGCRRLVVVTTNDNLAALRFYQHRGFVLAEVRPNALAHSRTLKPQIPLCGSDDIPLRDEIELLLPLAGSVVQE